MKRLFICTLILSMAFLLQGCRKKHVGPENGFVWYETKENGLIGAVDKNENELLPCQFKSIKLDDDYANGNSWYEYEWQLKWTVIDQYDKELHITLYIYDDGWRYYEIHYENKSCLAIQNYNNITMSFNVFCSFVLTYHNKSVFRDAQGLTKLKYFYVTADGIGDGFYRADGTPIIPVERKYRLIRPHEKDNRAWYDCQLDYDNNYRMSVVCNSQGTEIFRYSNAGGCEYDSEKGFYAPLSYINETHYTNIKLGKNSSSFNVEPSGDNDPAKVIDIRTYKQSSGSVYPSYNYYGGGQYMPTSNYEMPTYNNESNGNSGLSAAQYQQNYNGYENIAEGVIRSLQMNSNMNYGPRSQNMQTLNDAQNNMRRIRQEAASHGITIPQSYYETARP